MTTKIGLLASVALTVSATTAFAHSYHHHHHARQAVAYAPATPAYGGNWEADAIARATERAQNEPGVTNELAPDSRQTATGGPVGGVPGFDGT